jgi:hypothetical protein
LNKRTKANGDGPIVPGDDAQDFSDEDSLAEDEGDEGVGDDDIDALMQEGQVKPDDDEEQMSMDLFGPEMSSQPAGQQFGADTFIALLGHGNEDPQGIQWSDEPHDGMFDELSPRDNGMPSEDEMDVQEDMFGDVPEPKKSSAELVREWFPQFNPDEIPRFTEIFGSKQAELSRPLATRTPRGMSLLVCLIQFASPRDSILKRNRMSSRCSKVSFLLRGLGQTLSGSKGGKWCMSRNPRRKLLQPQQRL